MKSARKQADEVISSQQFETVSYQAQMGADAADVLSRLLYRDPIQACVREITANAIDSHIAAGKADEPVNVHLPTENEPFFRVADRGVGLSLDEAKELVAVYFSSRTRECDRGIGHFGLGFKSPFSYVNQFTTRCVKDGRFADLVAMFDGHGVPSLSIVREGETDESNGVSVRFEVERDDIYRFLAAALTIYATLPVPPALEDPEHAAHLDSCRAELASSVSMRGDGWYAFDLSCLKARIPATRLDVGQITPISTNAQHQFNAVVLGGIAYPLDIRKVVDSHEASVELEGSHALKQASGLVIDLDMATEAIEMDPGREGLRYTSVTVDVIRRRLNAVVADIRAEYDRLLEGKSLWARMALLCESAATLPLWTRAVVGLPNENTISCAVFDRAIREFGTQIRLYSLRMGRDMYEREHVGPHSLDSRRYRTHGPWPTDPRFVSIRPGRNTLVFIDDGGRAPKQMMREEALSRSGQRGAADIDIVFIKPGPSVSDTGRFTLATQMVIEALGRPPIIRTRELWAAQRGAARATPHAAAGTGFMRTLKVLTGASECETGIALSEYDLSTRKALLDGSARAIITGFHRGSVIPLNGDPYPDLVRTAARLSWLRHALARIRAAHPGDMIIGFRDSEQGLAERFPNRIHLGELVADTLAATFVECREALQKLRLRDTRTRFCRNIAKKEPVSWLGDSEYCYEQWAELLGAYVKRHGAEALPAQLRETLPAFSRLARIMGNRYRYRQYDKGELGALSALLERLDEGELNALGIDLAPILDAQSRYAERLAEIYVGPEVALSDVLSSYGERALHAALVYGDERESLIRAIRLERLAEEQGV